MRTLSSLLVLVCGVLLVVLVATLPSGVHAARDTPRHAVQSDDASAGDAPLIRLRTAVINPGTGHVSHVPVTPAGESAHDRIASAPDWVHEAGDAIQDDVGAKQYLVSVQDPSDTVVFLLEQSMGAEGEVLHYMPDNAYLVAATPAAADRLKEVEGVRWVGPYEPEYKMAPELFAESGAVGVQAYAQDVPTEQRYLVTFAGGPGFTATDAAHLAAMWQQQLATQGLESVFDVGSAARAFFTVLYGDSAVALAYLAQQPAVHWIEPHIPETVDNLFTSRVLQSEHMNVTAIWDRGLRGEGEVVGAADTGIDYDHCFFWDPSQGAPTRTVRTSQRKIIGYDPIVDFGDYANGHGTHVVGTMVAEAQSTNAAHQQYASQFNGIAFRAKIAFSDVGAGGGSLSLPSDMTATMFPWAYNAGVRIHSNSWGSSTNTYTSRSQDMDRFSHLNPDFLIFKSAGNSGPGLGTITSPGSAKNLISVGATLSDADAWRFYCCSAGSYSCCTNPAFDCTTSCAAVPRGSGPTPNSLGSFSSRGPCSDGRLGPLVTAPGARIFSAYSDGSLSSFQCGNSVGVTVISKQGTSMAAPAAAAATALIRQYLREGWYPTGVRTASNAMLPSSALLKAMLITSARPMSGVGTSVPDMHQGYGRIDLSNVLRFPDSPHNLWVDDSGVLASGQTMERCLAVRGSSRPVVVTLVWTDPPAALSSSVALINDLDLVVLDAENRQYLGNGVVDRLNNVERVVINNPPVGLLRIRVRGATVPQGPQRYALAATGVFDPAPNCVATTAPCCGAPHEQRTCPFC